MIASLLNGIFGTKQERDLKELLPLLRSVNSYETWAMGLSADEVKAQTQAFKQELANGISLDGLLPRVFALSREACRRVLGERPYDVQMLGGIALHQGRIVEMKTGEGKTLTGVAPAYLNALAGKGVHIVTVNDYLAERDKTWMEGIQNYLGLSVGVILGNMSSIERRDAYNCDITYATNNELGFDYLRDNMVWDLQAKSQRGHAYAIIDEIDSILIDEARTPLIISGADEEEDTTSIALINGLVSFFDEVEKDSKTGQYPLEDPLVKTVHVGDYKLDEKSKRILFTDAGMNKMEKLLQQHKLITGSLFDEGNFEFVHYFTQAIKAHKLFHIDVDYVIQDDLVQIVDEFTGRVLHGRRYSDGLHQAIEAKERMQVAKRSITMATITFQNFFRMYGKISGMTGTAETEAREFTRIYKLDVCVIPSNRLIARIDEQDEIYLDEKFKMQAIAQDVKTRHVTGQPILVGTVSVEKSERLAKELTKAGVPHEILNAKNHGREALIIAEAGAKGSVTIATNMAGRGTDIKLGGNPEMRARKMVDQEKNPDEYEHVYKRELAKCQAEYVTVKELGGLCIIGTERHESRRIDNQLRGRAGRQGDPGYSKFYVSLDDDLMRLFGGERFRSMMARFGMDSGEALQHGLVSKSIERAQKRVEERNYEIRKHLLDYDDVLNRQRLVIYSLRDSMLLDKNIKDRLIRTANELTDELLAGYTKEDGHLNEEQRAALGRELWEQLGFEAEDSNAFFSLKLADKRKVILEFFSTDLAHKEELMGSDNFNRFLQFEYLRTLDRKWQEHLETMEGLREAVNLRSYAQRNPLVEYKLEGFQLFDTLLDDMAHLLVARIFKVRLRQDTPLQKPQAVRGEGKHISMGNTLGQVPQGGKKMVAAMPSTASRPITTQKVGRNDPCPCGSGKKYKQCHGA